MDVEEFRVRGKEMVEYICNYMITLPERRVTPNLTPGYMRPELPGEAPQLPEPWDDVLDDVEKKIMPGVNHWNHPNFHAYFPSGNAYPSILGDMLSGALGVLGFSWISCPSCTELEIIMLNWMGKAIGLPPKFLVLEKGSKGGGVMQGSASDCIFVCFVAARDSKIKELKEQQPEVDEGVLLSKLVAYTSVEAHSCVEKGAMVAFVKLRILPTDENGSFRGTTLKSAMEADVAAGLIPFFVSATLGTTGGCAYDNIEELGLVVRQYPSVWFHVDGAYAGNSFICPEHQYRLKGIEYANSFNMNPNKLLLTNFDCSLMWVADRFKLTKAFAVDPLYLQHQYDSTSIDYRHWGVPLSRRFRSLKLWFVLRNYGISGLQNYVRLHCQMAKYFEKLVRKDDRFLVCNQVTLGLVCFRLKGDPNDAGEDIDKLNTKLLENINATGQLFMIPCLLSGRYSIRFCVTAEHSTEEDMEFGWKIITKYADELLEARDNVKDRIIEKHTELVASESYFARIAGNLRMCNSVIDNLPPMPENISKTKITSWIISPLGLPCQSDIDVNKTS